MGFLDCFGRECAKFGRECAQGSTPGKVSWEFRTLRGVVGALRGVLGPAGQGAGFRGLKVLILRVLRASRVRVLELRGLGLRRLRVAGFKV